MVVMALQVDLKPTNVDWIRSRLGHSKTGLRASDVREQYLDKLSRMVTDVDVRTELGESAFSRTDTRNDYYIEIPQDVRGQKKTNLSNKTWALLFQETVLFHEIGHVLWSDFNQLEKTQNKIRATENETAAEIFQRIYNALEDGVIETFLAREYNIKEDLIVMNANLTAHIDENKKSYGFYEAVERGLLDNGFYDSGTWDKIVDGEYEVTSQYLAGDARDLLEEYADRIEEIAAEAKQTADGTERVKMAESLARDLLDELPAPENNEESSNHTPGDHDEQQGQNESERSSGDQEQDEEEVPTEPDQREENENEEDEEEQTGSSGVGDEEGEDGEDGAAVDGDEVELDELEEDIEDDHQTEVERQKEEKENQEESPMIEQLEDMAQSAELTGTISIPEWDMSSKCEEDARTARQRGESLERILRSQLQRERNTARKEGLREGRLNTSDLAAATTGSQHVFEREERPEDKDYSVQIVLDRSGSMGGDATANEDRLHGAQKAAAQLAYGLYGVGVDVSVMSMYETKPFIEVPFNSDPHQYEDELFSFKSYGSTPLDETVELARDYIENGAYDNQFVIVICDGEPDNRSNYKKVIKEMDSNIYGVYINENADDMVGQHKDLFDVLRYATPDEVDQVVMSLCKRFVD